MIKPVTYETKEDMIEGEGYWPTRPVQIVYDFETEVEEVSFDHPDLDPESFLTLTLSYDADYESGNRDVGQADDWYVTRFIVLSAYEVETGKTFTRKSHPELIGRLEREVPGLWEACENATEYL